ncbi:MAG: low-specificity L-threonine aldolase [Lachnospiraceae bacterium]|jgi:threonine aldolase|nr:low-specificity L-threonine aldolase [Lachnospiraceae bacterium]
MKALDFRSDTVTHPTPAMREAMFRAEVGDDVYQDDPTTNRLEEIAAEMLGMEAALFVPSGTMGNQLALMTHTRRGDEAIVSINSHIFEHEVGAAAGLSGLNLHPLQFPDGIYDASQIEKAVRSTDIHEPPTTLICLENALANGRVVPLKTMQDIQKMAKERDILLHMDGARLFNAAIALGLDVKQLTACVDSVSCCLSKGLCAPIGSVLCGSAEFILRARKNRKMLGGGMRQTGILAAAGILSLTEMTKRLKEDHENARYLAELLSRIPGVSVDTESVQINMVFATMDWPELDQLQPWLEEKNVRIGAYTGPEVRFVTHYGVTAEDVEHLAGLLAEFHKSRVSG